MSAPAEGLGISARGLSRRFGAPDAQTLALLQAIDSIEKLDDLQQRSFIVSNWNELLGQ